MTESEQELIIYWILYWTLSAPLLSFRPHLPPDLALWGSDHLMQAPPRPPGLVPVLLPLTSHIRDLTRHPSMGQPKSVRELMLGEGNLCPPGGRSQWLNSPPFLPPYSLSPHPPPHFPGAITQWLKRFHGEVEICPSPLLHPPFPHIYFLAVLMLPIDPCLRLCFLGN